MLVEMVVWFQLLYGYTPCCSRIVAKPTGAVGQSVCKTKGWSLPGQFWELLVSLTYDQWVNAMVQQLLVFGGPSVSSGQKLGDQRVVDMDGAVCGYLSCQVGQIDHDRWVIALWQYLCYSCPIG